MDRQTLRALAHADHPIAAPVGDRTVTDLLDRAIRRPDAPVLDQYEWSWTGSLAAWALDHPDHPDRDQVLATSAAHRAGRLGGYRGVLGFVTLVLRPTP